METKWNAYPKMKPEKEGFYLVTVIDEDEENRVQFCRWDRGGWNSFLYKNITAWAESPKPYEKPTTLKAYPIVSLPPKTMVVFLDKNNREETTIRFWDPAFQKHPKHIGFTHWAEIPEFDFGDNE